MNILSCIYVRVHSVCAIKMRYILILSYRPFPTTCLMVDPRRLIAPAPELQAGKTQLAQTQNTRATTAPEASLGAHIALRWHHIVKTINFRRIVLVQGMTWLPFVLPLSVTMARTENSVKQYVL